MRTLLGVAIALWATSAMGGGGNLLENGDLENTENPLAGWTVDYEWTENKVYMNNKDCVSVVRQDGVKRNVLNIAPAGESRVESKLIPFDPKKRYRCTMDVKAVKGLPTRIYFAGYRWKPGIRPHEDPYPSDMRMVYKSKAISDLPNSWKTVALEFPMQKLSAAAKKHLAQVRFFSLYVWTSQGVAIDNVQILETF